MFNFEDYNEKIEADRLEKITANMFQQKVTTGGSYIFASGLKVDFILMIFNGRNQLNLEYVNPENGQEKRTYIMMIHEWCNFGGYRTYFDCPRCDHRRSTLYFFEGKFWCRQCHGLTYELNNLNHRSTAYKIASYAKINQKLHRLNASIKRTSYAGKRTRNFLRLGRIYARHKALSEQVHAYLDNKLAMLKS